MTERASALDLDLLALILDEDVDVGFVKIGTLVIFHDFHAVGAFHKHLHRAVRQAQKLKNVGDGAHTVDGIGRRIIVRSVDLRGKHDLLVRTHHLFQSGNGFLSAHEQGHDHVREHHDVAQRQHRVGAGHGVAIGRGVIDIFVSHSLAFTRGRGHTVRTTGNQGHGWAPLTVSRRS